MLVVLNFSMNQLNGCIPASLGSLISMDTLNLSQNQLGCSIPVDLKSIATLDYLDLSSNRLVGPIPPDLGDLTNLNVLDLQNNHFIGDIPATFINLVNLVDPGQNNGDDGLDLDYNHINVPPDYPNPTNPLQVFLFQKDPDWHLTQSAMPIFFLPVIQH
jgi:hypothetical protein